MIPTYNFSGIQTYIMPDTVVAILDPDNPENNFEFKHTYDDVILSELIIPVRQRLRI